MKNTFVLNPKFHIYDNGQEICFYNSEETKGTVLRGIGVEFFRSINEKSKPLDLDLPHVDETIDGEIWSEFLGSLIEKKIIIDKNDILNKNKKNAGNFTISVIGTHKMINQLLDLLRKVGFENFIIESGEKLEFSRHTEMNIKTVESLKDMSKENTNIIIFADERADIKKTRHLNEMSTSKGIPFISLRMYSNSFELGPLVLPGQSACFECYWQRLQSTSDYTTDWHLDYISGDINSSQSPEFFLNQNIALQYLTMECLRFSLQEKIPISLGHVLSHDFSNGILRRSSILEIPGCEICKSAGGISDEV